MGQTYCDGTEARSHLPPALGGNEVTANGWVKKPFHRWFQFPVGFSPWLVEHAIVDSKLKPGCRIYDPFVGSGTTLIVSRMRGFESHGLEAHPFIYFIARTKMDWVYSEDLRREAIYLHERVRADGRVVDCVSEELNLPKLLYSCYSRNQLSELLAIREEVELLGSDSALRNLALLALAAIARKAAAVSTKWPNVEPGRIRAREPKRARDLFREQLDLMLTDLAQVSACADWPVANVAHADARKAHPYLESGTVDLVVTSAPYLNNFDYADRTRLETYLLGIYSSWGEISADVRSRLMISATTQLSAISKSSEELIRDISDLDAEVGEEVRTLHLAVKSARLACKGDKKFDVILAAYFHDMAEVLANSLALLRPGGKLMMVLGDSAHYGVHVPTDEIVARLALAIGYRAPSLHKLRSRGTKWAAVRRSPEIPLRESLVSLSA